jgi:transposase
MFMESLPKGVQKGRREEGYKVTREAYSWILERKQVNRSLTGAELSNEIYVRYQVQVTVQHINRLVKAVGLASPCGGRRTKKGLASISETSAVG